MHATFHALLSGTRPIVSDGAWGTELQARGLKPGECPDAWNLSRPADVEAVAAAYVAAGSRIILSNTFGANRLLLAAHGLADQTVAINRAGAAISRRAAGKQAAVFASIGPTGKVLAMGDITVDALRTSFLEQARALADGGADGVVVETFSDLDEARCAVEAVCAVGLPVIASMAFTTGKQQDRTSFGVTPEAAATALAAAGADAVGANCGLGLAQMIPICQRLKAACSAPLWIKPNAGLPKLENGTVIYPITAAEFAVGARALVAAGATCIGGCCGTGPEHIRALVASVAARA